MLELTPPQDPVTLVLSRLRSMGKVSPTSNGWKAHCPAHDDRHESLGVKVCEDGRVLLRCHAGCDYRQISAALGIRVHDLFAQRGSARARSSSTPKPVAPPPRLKLAPAPREPLGRIDATYDYLDENGGHLFQVVRFAPKAFRQRRRDPTQPSGWTWNVHGVQQVLYRLPQVLAAVRAGTTIWVVEGEKDVGSLEAIGLVATCNAGGASKNPLAPKWRREHADALHGAKQVVVIADRDEAGRAHAIAIASSLLGTVDDLRALELPGEKVKDASDWLAFGGTRQNLEQLVAEAPAWTPPPDGPVAKGGGDGGGSLPVIRVGNRQLRDVLIDAWAAVHADNSPPKVFWRGGLMARIVEGPVGPHIQEMTATAIYGHLARVADWTAYFKEQLVNVYPDVPVSKDMQDRPDRALPELEAIVGSPVFDAAGDLVAEPGYHPGAKLWLHHAAGFAVAPVPEKPSSEQVAQALEFILGEILVDFDFATAADRANAVAMLLGPPTRRLISGLTPMFLVEAPTPASGKSLLADMVGIPATGQVCAITTYTDDQDELRKRVTAQLIAARPIMLIDNLPQEDINSPVLAAATTAEIWEDRILGFQQMVQVPNRGCWLLTGNNPILSEELARRCIRIRIDQKIDRPWQSKRVFRHEDLRAWAKEHRGEFVHALLTLVRGWLAAGRPRSVSRLGSFESWSRIVGGILDVAGVVGFLGNADELYEQADVRGREWREFVRAWWTEHRSRPMKVGELVNLIGRNNLLPTALKGKSFRSRAAELGKALREVRGKRYDDLALTDAEDKHANCTLYQLVEVKPEASAPLPAQGELAPHWSDGPQSRDGDRGDDPDAY